MLVWDDFLESINFLKKIFWAACFDFAHVIINLCVIQSFKFTLLIEKKLKFEIYVLLFLVSILF
jgi:hypothetical protein